MANKQLKLYRAGQKPKGGGAKIVSGVQQDKTSAKQTGKTHSVKNRSVNHGRFR